MYHGRSPRERGGALARDPNVRLAYSTGGETEAKPPAPRPVSSRAIRLRLERRASDRLVTSISGLPGSAAEVAALAGSLKAACGAGGTVKAGVVELQGDHRDAVEAFLAARGLKSRRAGG